MTTDELRAKFEAHFSQPPYEWEFVRLSSTSAWHNMYSPYYMQCAWEGWLAAHASRDAEVEALRKDAERLNWLETQREAYGFEDCHEGNQWVVDGPFNTARDAIDALLRERESAKVTVTEDIARKLGDEYFRLCKEADRVPLQAGFWIKQLHMAIEAVAPILARSQQPIPMILHCPSCHAQHIDRSEINVGQPDEPWTNSPHRSHLCHNCGTVWRPADVPTTGVEGIQTQGKNDVVMPTSMLASARVPDGCFVALTEPTEEQVAETVYNINRKTAADTVTPDMVRQIWNGMVHARPIKQVNAMLAAAPKPEKE